MPYPLNSVSFGGDYAIYGLRKKVRSAKPSFLQWERHNDSISQVNHDMEFEYEAEL